MINTKEVLLNIVKDKSESNFTVPLSTILKALNIFLVLYTNLNKDRFNEYPHIPVLYNEV